MTQDQFMRLQFWEYASLLEYHNNKTRDRQYLAWIAGGRQQDFEEVFPDPRKTQGSSRSIETCEKLAKEKQIPNEL